MSCGLRTQEGQKDFQKGVGRSLGCLPGYFRAERSSCSGSLGNYYYYSWGFLNIIIIVWILPHPQTPSLLIKDPVLSLGCRVLLVTPAFRSRRIRSLGAFVG